MSFSSDMIMIVKIALNNKSITQPTFKYKYFVQISTHFYFSYIQTIIIPYEMRDKMKKLQMDILRTMREEKNLTQGQVADILGINRSTYSSYETVRDTIPIIHLNRLGVYFDVSIDYILGHNKVKKYSNSKKDIDLTKMAERLKTLRKEYKITQIEMAKELNIARSTWTYYESGKNLIGTLLLDHLASKYHYSIDYLLGKIDENYLKTPKK